MLFESQVEPVGPRRMAVEASGLSHQRGMFPDFLIEAKIAAVACCETGAPITSLSWEDLHGHVCHTLSVLDTSTKGHATGVACM
jgi:hypothetical protein